nr:hypothetical protein [Tanacetum cinerariifolium]
MDYELRIGSIESLRMKAGGLPCCFNYVRNTLRIYQLVKSMLNSKNRSSYTRVMIKLRADVELKDTIIVAMPKLVDVVKNLKNPRQAVRGVSVGLKVGFKLVKKLYRHVSNNIVNTNGKKKQNMVPKQDDSNSNPFEVLNSIKNDDDLGSNKGNSKSARKRSLNVVHGNYSNTPITDKIDKLECQILDDKHMFVDDDGNPLVLTVNVDSKSVVEVVFDEITNLMASKSFKGRTNRGYDTNSLLEQLRETKRDDDYDPYDDDLIRTILTIGRTENTTRSDILLIHNLVNVSLIVGLDLSTLAIILNRLRKIHSKGLTSGDDNDGEHPETSNPLPPVPPPT